MSDIFDDVEKLLAEESANMAASNETSSMESSSEITSEVVSTEEDSSEAQSFNESELEDIMAEIESLESDFVEAQPVESEAFVTIVEKTVEPVATETNFDLRFDSKQTKKTDLQKEIEREIAIINQKLAENNLKNESSSTIVDESSLENIILPFEKKTVFENTPSTNSDAGISFTAAGNMDLNLAFKIGSEEAKLVIDQKRGLVVTLSGVELCLDEKNGCTVTMDNGVKFNIPLTVKDSSSKKKAA